VGTIGNILHVASGGYHLVAFPDDPCGLEELHPELGSPCGSPSHPIASESDACRSSPPYQPSSTLRLGGLGTNGNILHVASGDNLSDASPDMTLAV
jgi:hypothetical protein